MFGALCAKIRRDFAKVNQRLIHFYESTKDSESVRDSLPQTAQSRLVWGGTRTPHTDTNCERKAPFGAFPGLCRGSVRTTYYCRVQSDTHKIPII